MIPPEQIAQDFAQLAKISKCVRTYSVQNGLDKAPEALIGLFEGRNKGKMAVRV